MKSFRLPAIKRIEALVQSNPNGISFAQGALRVGGVPEAIRAHAQAILKTAQADFYQAPLGIMPLRTVLAQKLSKDFSCSLSADNIMVSHGSVTALMAFCLLLLDAGDEVVVPQPTYPGYFNAIAVAKGQIVPVAAYQQQVHGWNFNIDAIKQAVTSKTKAIIFSNPSNPLGYAVSQAELEALIAFCEGKGIYLLLDEVYDDYIFEGKFCSITPYIQASRFVVKLSSFSKNFAMSGWRVGYLAAHPELITLLAPVQDAILICPNVLAQYAALYALEHPDLILPSVKKVQESRRITLELLEPVRAAGVISYVVPTSGFYLFIKTELSDTEPFVMDILEQTGVGLIPGKDFGPDGAAYIRLCYAREPELVREGVARLVQYLMADKERLVSQTISLIK